MAWSDTRQIYFKNMKINSQMCYVHQSWIQSFFENTASGRISIALSIGTASGAYKKF